MKLQHVTVRVDAEKPFRALHLSDNHLCLADERDNERKQALAERRGRAFAGDHPDRLLERLTEQLDYAVSEGLFLIYSGDVIDFVSEKNLETAGALLSRADTFMAAGNHEYSQYVGEAWEDEVYKAQSFDAVMDAMPGNVWFQTRIIHGVKFIALDNNYYYVTEALFDRFREAVSDGMPVVLVVHNPLYSPDTYEKVMAGKPADTPPYLFGCPEELLRGLDDHRYRQQKPDDLTVDFVRFCANTPNLKAVLAGHLHQFCAAELTSGIPQIIAGAGYAGDAVEYCFI